MNIPEPGTVVHLKPRAHCNQDDCAIISEMFEFFDTDVVVAETPEHVLKVWNIPVFLIEGSECGFKPEWIDHIVKLPDPGVPVVLNDLF